MMSSWPDSWTSPRIQIVTQHSNELENGAHRCGLHRKKMGRQIWNKAIVRRHKNVLATKLLGRRKTRASGRLLLC